MENDRGNRKTVVVPNSSSLIPNRPYEPGLMWETRVLCLLAQGALFLSYWKFFPPAIRGLCYERAFSNLPGLAGLDALPWNTYFSLGRLTLALLASLIFLDAAFRFGSLGCLKIKRDRKSPIMFGAFLMFYMGPPLFLTGFKIAPAWGFWALAGIAASIISIALYGLEMFPLGPREMAEFYRHPQVHFTDETARVRAIAAVLSQEQTIVQMTLTIAVALAVTAGVGVLNGGVHLFQDKSNFVAVIVLWGPPVVMLAVEYIYYYIKQFAKASQLSEILHQTLFLPPGSPLWGKPQGAQLYPHGFGCYVGVVRDLGRATRAPALALRKVVCRALKWLMHRRQS